MNVRSLVLSFLALMPNLPNHFLRTTNRLPGGICSSILNSVTAIVLTAPPILRRVTELSAQAFRTVIQPTPDKFLWSCRDLSFRFPLYGCFFLYLFDTESPLILIKFQFIANKLAAIIVQHDGGGICGTLLLGEQSC